MSQNRSQLVTQPASPRPGLSYGKGHGDFCFNRLDIRERRRLGMNDFFTDEQLLAGTHNVLFRDIGSFQRSGPFQFFKLPVEIRRRIFQFLLAPFFESGSDNETNCIDIFIRPQWKFSLAEAGYDGDFEAHRARIAAEKPNAINLWLARQTSGWMGDESLPASNRMTEAEYYKAKCDFIHMQKQHPQRSYPYKMDCTPSKGIVPEDVCFKDWGMIDLIRNLSHVSTQFKKEVGDAFWSRTCILCVDDWDFGSLQPFLEDRPGCHNFIKHLVISLDMLYAAQTSGRDIGSQKSSELFLSLCQYMSKTLVLDTFTLSMVIEEEYLLELARRQGRFIFLGAGIRSLNVAQKFLLRPYIQTSNPELDDGRAYERALRHKYVPMIRDFLMPERLRGSEQTEKDLYLRSRPRTLSVSTQSGFDDSDGYDSLYGDSDEQRDATQNSDEVFDQDEDSGEEEEGNSDGYEEADPFDDDLGED